MIATDSRIILKTKMYVVIILSDSENEAETPDVVGAYLRSDNDQPQGMFRTKAEAKRVKRLLADRYPSCKYKVGTVYF